jgi:aminopeptidase N
MRSAVLALLVVACSHLTPEAASIKSSSRAAPTHAASPAVAGPAAIRPVVNASAPEPASCVDDGAPYDAASLHARVAYLASTELDGRAPGTAADAAARRYIADRFRCLGLTAGGTGGSYEQPFVADGHATANVVGFLAGDDPAVGRDIIVVGAHHDHVGRGHLGANDNASGVAALLAIAQAVRQHGKPHRTIAFVAFAGEELGLLGSAHFAAHPPAALPLDRVVYDINLDMVGSYASTGAVYAMGTFRGLAATPIVQALADERRGLRVGTGGRGAGSDHEAFCRAGVPYVFFWTPDKRCYHERCDTVDRLDAEHLAQIAGVAGELVERLSSSSADLAEARPRLGCTGSPRR